MDDSIQRQKALDIRSSYIVQAPAGSGKTGLLVQRYLKLLTICDEPENVIVVTFTNKAVSELIERVLNALRAVDKKKPVSHYERITYNLAFLVIQRCKQKNWQLLQIPQRLKISTIDSLFNLIVNLYPDIKQLMPLRIMADRWEQNKVYRLATEQTLLMIDESMQYSNDVASLLLYFDNNIEKFCRMVTYMLAKRDQWLRCLYKDDNLDFLKNTITEIINEHLRLLKDEAQKHIDDNFFKLIAASSQYCHIKVLPNACTNDLTKWQHIRMLCLTNSGEWRKTITKRQGFDVSAKEEKNKFIKVLQRLQECNLLKELLYELDFLPDADFTQKDILITILNVLKLAVAHLKLLFIHESAYDFIEVALLANNALDNSDNISNVALFFDYKVEHILVDEFQDISYPQFSLIEKLITNWLPQDNKTIFLVGDPMQSIYRFRESHVGLFLLVKENGIANIRPQLLQLSTNFRSIKSIVNSNNNIFAKVFPQKDDIIRGAISYLKANAKSNVEDASAITFFPFFEGQYENEALQVLNIINNTFKQASQDNIAILVRSRKHLTKVIELFKAKKVNFEALKIDVLQDHILTRDLLVLTKALLNLGDKLAWLALLRSPWCGLLLKDLLVIADDDDLVVYQKLVNTTIIAQLTADGQKRVAYIRQCLFNIIDNNKERFSFVELLTHAIEQLGINKYLSMSEILLKEQFLQIVHICEQQDILDIQSITDILSDRYASSTTACVKLMTIHEAKGLEFDTVIILGLGRIPPSDKDPIIRMKEFTNKKLLLAPIKSFNTNVDNSKTYNYLKFIENKQNKFETMRLLYVAMTRAKKKLYLLGAVRKLQKGKPLAANKASFLQLLLPFYENTFQNMQAVAKDDLSLLQEPPKLKRFKQINISFEKYKFEKATTAYDMNFELLFKSILGILVHQYYEHNLFYPDKKDITARLAEKGVAPDKIDEYVAQIITLLTNTEQDIKFNWLFKKRKSTLVEAEFFSGTNKSIIVDRLFIDKDILWIIDFKTSQPLTNESINEFIKRQQKKHSEQLLFYQEVIKNIYPNKIKCALYCPFVKELIEVIT